MLHHSGREIRLFRGVLPPQPRGPSPRTLAACRTNRLAAVLPAAKSMIYRNSRRRREVCSASLCDVFVSCSPPLWEPQSVLNSMFPSEYTLGLSSPRWVYVYVCVCVFVCVVCVRTICVPTIRKWTFIFLADWFSRAFFNGFVFRCWAASSYIFHDILRSSCQQYFSSFHLPETSISYFYGLCSSLLHHSLSFGPVQLLSRSGALWCVECGS